MAAVPLADTPVGVDPAAWMAACAAVRAYCGWHVAPIATETVTLDGRGARRYFLPTLRLHSLNTLTVDGLVVMNAEWSEMGEVRGVYSHRLRGIVAEITHGFESCPADILSVLGDIVVAAGREGASAVASGTHSVRFEAALSERHRTMLDQYRLVSVA